MDLKVDGRAMKADRRAVKKVRKSVSAKIAKSAKSAASTKTGKGKSASAKGKAKREVVKYHKISFAISEKERDELLRFCKQDGIALKALFKKAVRLYVKDRLETIRQEEEAAENQFDLFEPVPYQTTLF